MGKKSIRQDLTEPLKKLSLRALIFALGLSYFSGCGYGLRGNSRQFMEENGIRTLHVSSVKNDSYKAGIDITVYNAVRKRISAGGYVRLVDNPDMADAILDVTVTTANYQPVAVTTADKLAPLESGPDSMQVATSYVVSLSCLFKLTKKKENKQIWSNGFQRSKSFAASTYLGALGSTSALINESEFERTLLNLSESVAVDADETMNAYF